MAPTEEKISRREYAKQDEPEKYPLLVRIYGVLGIIAGIDQIIAFVLAILAVFFGDVDLSALDDHTTTTLVIGIVSIVVSVVLAVMFVILGVRLLRGKRHKAVLLCDIMIALEAVVLICHFMLTGMSRELIPPGINMIILIVLQSYSDPALRDERKLQRRLHELEWKSEAEDGTLGLDTTGKGYLTLNFFNIFWIFIVACVAGLIVEVIWHMVVVDPGVYQDRAGLLYGPFSPIYGVGAVLMTIALNRFHDKNPILIFLVSAFIGGAFEYFVSWFLQVAFGIVAWDYSGTFLNINGRTNFMFMCMWGVLGLLWVKFATPLLLKLINKIPWNWRYVVTGVCTVLMVIDCVLTLAAFDCWYKRAAGTMDYENQTAIEAFCNENYDDEFMENRFQSMTMNADNASRADKA
ncbi:MAG: putative ABC transporter permease [Eggerthellaceae bacterium]|nr:putative ABC transporter permease [Eggerthellaceae bacterium]